jgi:hypothetical protein
VSSVRLSEVVIVEALEGAEINLLCSDLKDYENIAVPAGAVIIIAGPMPLEEP